MADQMSVAVVIATMDRPEHLERNIESLSRSRIPPAEVVIVDIAAEGIPYGELTPDQQSLLMRLIETYVGRIRPGHAEIRLEEVQRHLPDTLFAWIGHCDEVSPFYYRIFSPVLLIEFDHQSGIALDNDAPSRQHIHTVVRTPNGNDYGKDLLRQHYEQVDHAPPHTVHRPGLR